MEEPVVLQCENIALYGIYHMPEDCVFPEVVVIMIVGGSQTKYGSHRLYLQVARFLHDNGIPVLRFDREGMGDSHGSYRGIKKADQAIQAAVDFVTLRHKNVSSVLWGICDGSTAAAIYADNNPDKVSGMILCNPFIHTEQGRSRAKLKYYYPQRLMDISFWMKLIKFELSYKETLKDLSNDIKKVSFSKRKRLSNIAQIEPSLPELVLGGMSRFGKPITCVLSTDDLLAREFIDAQKKSKKIVRLMKDGLITNRIIKDADHTFTSIDARTKLFDVTLQAIEEIIRFVNKEG